MNAPTAYTPDSLRVTILPGTVVTKNGSFEDDKGKERSYTTRVQKARAEANGFAYPLDVRLQDDQEPYPVGEYVMDFAAMVEINKGKLNLSKFHVLAPLAAKAKA